MAPPPVTIAIVGADGAAVEARQLLVEAHESSTPFASVAVVAAWEGRADALNRAIADAPSELVVVLDAAAHVEPGWLDGLVAAAARQPGAAAITSLAIDDEGMVVEAGRVLWREGTTSAIAPGRPVEDALARTAGRVDIASTQSMLVRRDAWLAADGLGADVAFAVAEADLCLRWRERGQHVWYTPSSRVVVDAGSPFVEGDGAAAMRERWGAVLDRDCLTQRYALAHVTSAVAWAARGGNRRVLIVDDVVPTDGMGAGFSRMRAVIERLVARGVRVALHPTYDPSPRDIPELGVEVVNDLAGHLADDRPWFDVILVSRPDNFHLVDRLAERWPGAAIVYDAEAVFATRAERRAAMIDEPAARQAAEREAEEVAALERSIAARADVVVSVSPAEQAWFAASPGARQVLLLPPVPARVAMGVQSFAARHGALFVSGWEAGGGSPNVDAAEWFVAEVLPTVLEVDPTFVLRITGKNPPPRIEALASPAVELLGHVDDLDAAYGATRLAIAPLRWGAGVKLKTIGALAAGVPVVATTVGAEGLPAPWAALVDVADDADGLAAAVTRLATDADAWATARALIADAHRAHRPDPDAWIAVLDRASEEHARVA